MEHEILEHSGQGDNPSPRSRPFTPRPLGQFSCFQNAGELDFQPVSSSTPMKQRASISNSTDLVQRSLSVPFLPQEAESKEKEPPTHTRFSLGSVGNKSSLGPPLFSSSLLNDPSDTLFEPSLDLDSMDQSQLKEAMENLLLENSVLKEEVQTKSKQLRTAKMQVQVLLDLEESTEPKEASVPRRESPLPVPKSLQNKSIVAYKRKREGEGCPLKIPMSKEMESEAPEDLELEAEDLSSSGRAPPIRMLPEHTFILIREITSRIEVYQVREKMIEGLHFSNQLVVGGAAGWMGGFLVKRFGKTVVTALGGGILILVVAKRKGFVEVNWSPIFQHLDRTIESRLASMNEGDPSQLALDEEWPMDKVKKAKEWVVQHSVAAVGFALGFFYNVVQN